MVRKKRNRRGYELPTTQEEFDKLTPNQQAKLLQHNPWMKFDRIKYDQKKKIECENCGTLVSRNHMRPHKENTPCIEKGKSIRR